MHRLYANTKLLYIRDVSIRGFWYSLGVLEPIPCGYQEMAVCHSLFIHAYVDAHLGHIHPLAIVDNAAINTGVQTFGESLLSILCHVINSMFNFLRNHQTFP